MTVRAAILAIGDELLSGRTRDTNIHFLAQWLNERGVTLSEVRIVADELDDIRDALNALRTRYDYVMTSGGIGPTHDDITFEAVAMAFGCRVVEHPQARKILDDWYTKKELEVTPERARMALMPEGARLIENKASGAPGIMIENVFVMAGVPRIFQAMVGAIEPYIEGGAKVHSKAVTAIGLPESKLARQLADIQGALNGVSIGSYPIDGDEMGVTIVARSENEALAETAIESVIAAMRALGFDPKAGDH